MTNKHSLSIYIYFISREKQKSEAKDRKVLEILQVKDAKIQELEQVGVTVGNTLTIINVLVDLCIILNYYFLPLCSLRI